MLTDEEFAKATLAGQVNDWVEQAKRNARNVLALSDRIRSLQDELASVRAHCEIELEAARRRVDAARSDAKDAQRRSEAVVASAAGVAAQLQHIKGLGRDLVGRIVELPRNEIRFVRGSKSVIEKFRREVSDAEVHSRESGS